MKQLAPQNKHIFAAFSDKYLIYNKIQQNTLLITWN